MIATGNLAVCACIGLVLHLATKPAPLISTAPGTATATSDPVVLPSPGSATRQPPTRTTTTTTTRAGIPAGFTTVNGPGGMTTVIPAGWSPMIGSGPGSVEATDPADATRNLRYGGSPHDSVDILTSHVEFAETLEKRPGHQRLRLDRVIFHGTDAVDWEFRVDGDDGTRHVRSLYWRQDGYEYFVYAGSAEERWPETQAILDTMIDNATP
ncbi:hypothetical protein [Alloactinosynnema sp. L-07]|uniref:hypothetical protein n=1 Tax=Alloactinosynnema sp. L-07 TaxID=1653480 RepID=UPI0012F9818A|nr:hypothetical protein [Alloactinosynnema sp. L-07]